MATLHVNILVPKLEVLYAKNWEKYRQAHIDSLESELQRGILSFLKQASGPHVIELKPLVEIDNPTDDVIEFSRECVISPYPITE